MDEKSSNPNATRRSTLRLAPVSPLSESARNSDDSEFDHKSNAIWIDKEVPEELFSSVVAHEFNHFLVHVSTPYGWFLDECVKLENNLVLSYCLDHYHRFPYSSIDIPIYDVAELAQEGKNSQFIRRLCDKYANPWSHITFLQRLLEGENSSDIDGTTVDLSTLSFNLVEKLLRKKKIVEPPKLVRLPKRHQLAVFDETESNQLRGMPSMVLPRGEINIGAKHVFEGIAVHHETKDSIVSGLKAESRRSYWALWVLTVSSMGKERVRSPQDYNRLLNTFYSLCDLALFVPAGSLYGQLRTKDMTWYDVQPGARFMTALRKAVTLGWVDDLETGMLPYQEWLSELLCWPSPKKFLELGAGLDQSDKRQARHAEACRIRLENHSAFIVLGKEFEAGSENTAATPAPFSVREFFANHRPMVYTAKLGQLVVEGRSDSPTDALSRLLDWFLARFNYQVMRKGIFGYDELLPDDVKYDSIWENIKSREELLALLQQAIPALTPDRFQSFDASLHDLD